MSGFARRSLVCVPFVLARQRALRGAKLEDSARQQKFKVLRHARRTHPEVPCQASLGSRTETAGSCLRRVATL